jgi:hypothetical protein
MDVGASVADNHWVGNRNAEQKKDLPTLAVGMFLVAMLDELTDPKYGWWSGKPFAVGRVTELLGDGKVRCQAYGCGTRSTSLAGAYYPAWQLPQTGMKDAKFRTSAPVGRSAILDTYEDSNLIWWDFDLTTNKLIPSGVLDMISYNPRVKWPSDNHPR